MQSPKPHSGTYRNLKVLLVEDNQDDAFFTQKALEIAGESLKLKIDLTLVEDGISAIEYLGSNQCDLVITDLQMPKMNGIELLNYLKNTTSYKVIPVVFLTTSDDDKDIEKAYLSNAAAYLCKPISNIKLQEVISSMLSFWSQVKFPKKRKS